MITAKEANKLVEKSNGFNEPEIKLILDEISTYITAKASNGTKCIDYTFNTILINKNTKGEVLRRLADNGYSSINNRTYPNKITISW